MVMWRVMETRGRQGERRVPSDKSSIASEKKTQNSETGLPKLGVREFVQTLIK